MLGLGLGINRGFVGGGGGAAAASFLLDDYTGAAAAYSVRRLASATTVLLRVRRETAGGAGDDDEADVAYDTNDELSLDSAISNASAGVTATTLGQFLNVGTVDGTTYTNPDSLTVTASCYVDTWYDQAGLNDAEQATYGSQPQIHGGTVDTDLISDNGKPALKCFNSEGLISTGAVVSFPITYFAAHTPAQSGVGIVGLDRPLSGSYTLIRPRADVIDVITNHDGYKPISHSASLTLGDMGLWRAVINGSSSQVGVNGSSTSGTLAASGSTQNISINYFAISGGTGNSINNFISEVLVFDDAKNSTDITGIETNINDYFSIYT